MVLGQGLLLTLFASAIGLAAAVALTRFMASMLFNVAPTDPLTFVLVGGVLGLVAMAATLRAGSARDEGKSGYRTA